MTTATSNSDENCSRITCDDFRFISASVIPRMNFETSIRFYRLILQMNSVFLIGLMGSACPTTLLRVTMYFLSLDDDLQIYTCIVGRTMRQVCFWLFHMLYVTWPRPYYALTHHICKTAYLLAIQCECVFGVHVWDHWSTMIYKQWGNRKNCKVTVSFTPWYEFSHSYV